MIFKRISRKQFYANTLHFSCPLPSHHPDSLPWSAMPVKKKSSRAARKRRRNQDNDERSGDDTNMLRVGAEYQAQIPDFDPGATNYADTDVGGTLLWSPHHNLPDATLAEFIARAKEEHTYNEEQALAMLFWHQYDIEKAVADLPAYAPKPEEWTEEEKILFEKAFKRQGKKFERIQKKLPTKEIRSLVKYYYSWKKTLTRRKVCNKKNQLPNTSTSCDEDVKKTPPQHRDVCAPEKSHAKGHAEQPVQSCEANQGKKACWSSRPDHHTQRAEQSPTGDTHLTQKDVATVSRSPNAANNVPRQPDAELSSPGGQLNQAAQAHSAGQQRAEGGVEESRPPRSDQKISAHWTVQEQLLAVQGGDRYGHDFQAIANAIGNKTADQVKYFLVTYRQQFKSEDVLQRWDAQQRAQAYNDASSQRAGTRQASHEPPREPHTPQAPQTLHQLPPVSSFLLKPTDPRAALNQPSPTYLLGVLALPGSSPFQQQQPGIIQLSLPYNYIQVPGPLTYLPTSLPQHGPFRPALGSVVNSQVYLPGFQQGHRPPFTQN